MPEIRELEVEGDMTLGYFSDRDGPRCVKLDDQPVAELVGQMLDFPSSEEFDAMFDRLNEMREAGVRPADGEPDVKREVGRYRIKIEKVE